MFVTWCVRTDTGNGDGNSNMDWILYAIGTLLTFLSVISDYVHKKYIRVFRRYRSDTLQLLQLSRDSAKTKVAG